MISKTLSNSDYHACRAISASMLKNLVKDEQQFLYDITHKSEPTDAMKRGSEMHELIENFAQGIDTPEMCFADAEYAEYGDDVPNRNTKAYREFKAKNSHLPDTHAFGMFQAVKNDKTANYLIKNATHIEASFFDSESIEKSDLRARLDMITKLNQNTVILDWKSISDIPTVRNMERAINKFKYWVPIGMYFHLLELNAITAQQFVFAFIRSKPPYQINYMLIDTHDIISAKNRILELIDRAKELIEGAEAQQPKIHIFDGEFYF